MLGSVLESAAQGLQFNQRKFEYHAGNISRWGTEDSAEGQDVNLGEELVGVLKSRRGYQANLMVVRAADDMLGSLIDIFA